MMERIAEASPRFKARMAGVFYLLTTLTRTFVEIFVRNRLVVSDDAAAGPEILGIGQVYSY